MSRESEIIRKFRITSKYKGYPLIIEAIQIATEHYGEYIQVTKDIYPVLAARHHISKESVERNIRTVVEKCWENDRELIQKMAGYKMTYCPTNSDFIDFAAYYIRVTQKV